jgi:transcriptional regulator with XRE-family HTH domain
VPSRKPDPCLARTKFGRNVARLRRNRGITQEEFAELVGISVRYAQSLEAGEYFPALPTLLKMKSVLQSTWDEIFADCK